MTSEGLENPDTRPLPANWVERFDSDQRVWYYLNISANPPIRSNLHPLGPLPFGGNFAQQLYASATPARNESPRPTSSEINNKKPEFDVPPPPALPSFNSGQGSGEGESSTQRGTTIYRTQRERYLELRGQRPTDSKVGIAEEVPDAYSYIAPPLGGASSSSDPPAFDITTDQQSVDLSRRPTMLPMYSLTAEEGLTVNIDNDEASSIATGLETVSIASERPEFVGRGFGDNTGQADSVANSSPPDLHTGMISPPPSFDTQSSHEIGNYTRTRTISSVTRASGSGETRRPLPSISSVSTTTSIDPTSQQIPLSTQNVSTSRRVSGPRPTTSSSTSSGASSYAIVNGSPDPSSPRVMTSSTSPDIANSPQSVSPQPVVRDSSAYAQALYASAFAPVTARQPATTSPSPPSALPPSNNPNNLRPGNNVGMRSASSPASQSVNIVTVASSAGGTTQTIQPPTVAAGPNTTSVNRAALVNAGSTTTLPLHRQSISGSPISVASSGSGTASSTSGFAQNISQSQAQVQSPYQAQHPASVSPTQQQQRTPYRYSQAMMGTPITNASSSTSSKAKKISLWGLSNTEKKREKERLEAERRARERAAADRERERAIAEGATRWIAPTPQTPNAQNIQVTSTIPNIQGSNNVQPRPLQGQVSQQSSIQPTQNNNGDVRAAVNIGVALGSAALNGASQAIFGTRLTGTANRPSALGTAITGLVNSIGNSGNSSNTSTTTTATAAVGGAIAGLAGAALLNEVTGNNNPLDPSTLLSNIDASSLISSFQLNNASNNELDLSTMINANPGIDFSSLIPGTDTSALSGIVGTDSTDLSNFNTNFTGTNVDIGYDPTALLNSILGGDNSQSTGSFDPSYGVDISSLNSVPLGGANDQDGFTSDSTAFDYDTTNNMNAFPTDAYPTDTPFDPSASAAYCDNGDSSSVPYMPLDQTQDPNYCTSNNSDPGVGLGSDPDNQQQDDNASQWSDQLSDMQQQQQDAIQKLQDRIEEMQHEAEHQHKLEEHALHHQQQQQQQQQFAQMQQEAHQQAQVQQQKINQLQHQLIQQQANHEAQMQSLQHAQAASQARIQQQIQTLLKAQQQANTRTYSQIQAIIAANNQRTEQLLSTHLTAIQGQTNAVQAHTMNVLIQTLRKMQQAQLQAISAALLRPNQPAGAVSGQGSSSVMTGNHGVPSATANLGAGSTSGATGQGPPVPPRPSNAPSPASSHHVQQNHLTTTQHPTAINHSNGVVKPNLAHGGHTTNTTGVHQAHHQGTTVAGNTHVTHLNPLQQHQVRPQVHSNPQQPHVSTPHSATSPTTQVVRPSAQHHSVGSIGSTLHAHGQTGHAQIRPSQITHHVGQTNHTNVALHSQVNHAIPALHTHSQPERNIA